MNITVTKKVSESGTWKELSDLIKKGEASNVLAIGDEIACKLTDGREIVWEIAAINPYPQYGNTVALVTKDCIEGSWPMNDTYEYGDAGGWKNCLMRARLETGIYPLLPDELKAIIVPRDVTQYLDGGKGEYEPVVSKGDKLWLLSSKEVFDIDSQCNADDVHFPLYKDERSRVKQYWEETTYWWLRSPYPFYTGDVHSVSVDGSLYYSSAITADGVAVACLIG